MNNPDISIRACQASDLRTLSAIWLDASLRAHPFLGEARLRAQQELVERTYLPDSETWVAVRDGEPVGFIGLIGAFIGALFVAPGLQGAGIGRLLIGHARALKGDLALDVYAENDGARAFYARLGFAEMGRSATDSEGLPFAVVHMRLTR